MAKKDKGKAGTKLPKEVLGFRLPKELRKAGNHLIEQAQSPAGRQAIAGVVTAMAGAAVTAAAARADEARHDTARSAKAPGEPPRPAPRGPDVQSMADAVEQGMEQVLGKLFGKAR